ncbi:MAG: citrate synthase [Aggregatilineales bacterium]
MELIMRPGLQGVIAAETRLSSIDGQAGELIIGGYPLEAIAPHATFEEMLYLLWHDTLPTAIQLTAFRDNLASKRDLPAIAIEALRSAAAQKLHVMDALRIAAGTLSLVVDSDDAVASSEVLVAAFPTIVATYWRFLHNQDAITPDATLSHAANYLYMLTGEHPAPDAVRALDTYLNTVIEHGFNASTFTARVIIATHSDMISAAVGAIGALKGPLHGGAPGPALGMVLEIANPGNAEANIRARLERGERLMGFGHRVYKVRDPRADVLNAAASEFFTSEDRAALYTLVRHVEKTAIRLLEEHKPGRNLQTNVEFYTALVLHGVGLHNDLFTPTFAIARVGGWTAHALEHLEEGRILRPLAAYTGVKNRQWTPVDAR